MSVPNIPNPRNRKGIPVLDLEGGAEFIIPVTITTDNAIDTGDALAVGGLQLTTAGVSDSTDKRFVTDAELAAISDIADADITADIITVGGLADVEPVLLAIGQLTGAETLLSHTPTVNLNTATPTTLFTVPTGKSAVITRVVLRAASGNLSTVEFSIGYNSADFDDVVDVTQPGQITGATLYAMLTIRSDAKVGTTTQLLKLFCSVLQGAPMTATFDVFGYIF